MGRALFWPAPTRFGLAPSERGAARPARAPPTWRPRPSARRPCRAPTSCDGNTGARANIVTGSLARRKRARRRPAPPVLLRNGARARQDLWPPGAATWGPGSGGRRARGLGATRPDRPDGRRINHAPRRIGGIGPILTVGADLTTVVASNWARVWFWCRGAHGRVAGAAVGFFTRFLARLHARQ